MTEGRTAAGTAMRGQRRSERLQRIGVEDWASGLLVALFTGSVVAVTGSVSAAA
jgi:hypothetical protein